MKKRIKRAATKGDKNYQGQIVEESVYYDITADEEIKFANDPDLDTDIDSGDIIFNDGMADITDIVIAKSCLKSITFPTNFIATDLVTTTATADILLPGMIIAPGKGDYLVMCSINMEGMDNDDHAIISIYNNGVQVAGTEMKQELRKNRFGSLHTHACILGVGDSEVIEIKWRTTDGDGIEATHRSLTIIQLNVAQS